MLRQITGHRLHPTVQQQHRQPQRSHFTLTGKFFFRQAFTRLILVLNSSGATCERREARIKSTQSGRKTIGQVIRTVKQYAEIRRGQPIVGGGADMRLAALIAVKKSCAQRSKNPKNPTGRYLQMLSRDEMRSLSTLSNQAAQLFKEARRDTGGGAR